MFKANLVKRKALKLQAQACACSYSVIIFGGLAKWKLRPSKYFGLDHKKESNKMIPANATQKQIVNVDRCIAKSKVKFFQSRIEFISIIIN